MEELPELTTLKVTQLREELQKRGLSTKGLKKDLVKRLEQILSSEQATLDQHKNEDDLGLDYKKTDEKDALESKKANEKMERGSSSDNEHHLHEIAIPSKSNSSLHPPLMSSVPLVESEHTEAIFPKSAFTSLNDDLSLSKPYSSDTIVVDYEEFYPKFDLLASTTSPSPLKRKEETIDVSDSRDKKFKKEPKIDTDFALLDNLQTSDESVHTGLPKHDHIHSLYLEITQLVRPFTASQLEKLLSNYGKIDKLWLNHIKSICFVSYTTLEEATSACLALDGKLWPLTTGKQLKVQCITETEFESGVEAERAIASASFKIGFDTLPDTLPKPHGTTALTSAAAAAGDTGNTVSHESDSPMSAQKEVCLNDLFKITETDPKLYYLPLSDE